MKITSATPSASIIIETDDGYTYRRESHNNWWMLMGNSWEACQLEEAELEAAYQSFLRE